MRARLGNMSPGQQFTFLCVPLMADGMNKVVAHAGGEIIMREERTYGVVLTIGKPGGTNLPAS